jgi:tetrahydromethanopterin S-methyltransferase subunit F
MEPRAFTLKKGEGERNGVAIPACQDLAEAASAQTYVMTVQGRQDFIPKREQLNSGSQKSRRGLHCGKPKDHPVCGGITRSRIEKLSATNMLS